jgi:hypothetical protein
VLRIKEDQKKEMLCQDHLMLELEEERKLAVVKKLRNYT